MEFRILGPLEAVGTGGVVSLGGRRQRALLAVLLLHRNELMTVDRLADELWGERLPNTAAKTVQVYVSRLRSELDQGRIETRGHAYVLRLEEGELDLDRFAVLVERAQGEEPGAAARTLREAHSLFRGEPLGDLGYEPWAQAEVARLRETRLATLEQRLEAELALGLHRALVAELEALVREHPMRERLRGQLMLALYRSGRQAEALENYQHARRMLTDELGLEPTEELKDLERAILAHDPSLKPAENVETEAETDEQLPSGSAAGIFVGRERELAALRAGLDEARAGCGSLFLISGEPGIGKSRLADELIRDARGLGARVLVGRSWEAGGAPAYWPWVQSLRSYIRQAESSALREQLGAGAADLAQILPELRQHFPDLPELPSLEAEGARFRLFDAAAEFLRNASANRPIVLVLDDLHAADAPSLLLLQFLARGLGSSRLLVLGAFRDVDPVPGQPLTEMLAEVAREPVTRRLSLAGLSEPNVARYVELTASEIASPELIAALYEETEGNPLFVCETVRLLSFEGDRPETDGSRLAIPQSIRDVIGRRLGHLSEECNRLLVCASVLGREFAVGTLARMGSVPDEAERLETLDEAMAARIIVDIPGSADRLRFTHVLIRDTLYEGLTTARRVRLHRLAGAALEALYGEEPGPQLAELAHHAIAASDFDGAVRYARHAGDRALTLLAYEEAARLYGVALDAVDRSYLPDETTRCELLLALAEARTLAGEGPAARDTFLLAAEIARKTRSPERLARAALGYGGRDFWGPRAEGEPKLVPLLQEALASCGDADSMLRARLLARLASSLRGAVDREQPASLAHQAVEMAVRIGDRSTVLFALGARLAATRGPGNSAESVADGVEVANLAETLDDAEYAFGAHENLFYATWTLGDRVAMARALDAMSHLARGLRQPAKEWCVAAGHAMSALSEGRLEAAEELIERAFHVGERAESWIAVSSNRLQTFMLRAQRGDLEGYEEVLRSSVDEYRGYTIFECVLAHAYFQLGRDSDARKAFESMAADDFRELSRDEDWLVNMCLLSEVCVHLDDANRAATLYRLLSPFGALNAVAQSEIALGSVAHSLGRLAAKLSRFEEAESHFEAALEMNTHMGAHPWLAQTREAYARMLLDRGTPGDTEMARILLDKALATYRELGMQTYAASAVTLTLDGGQFAR